MSLTVSHHFTVNANEAQDGDLLRVDLLDGSRLILTVRRKFSDGPCRLVLKDQWAPASLIRRTEDLALVMLRQDPNYMYGRTVFDRARIADFASEIRRETIIRSSAYVHDINSGSWLRGVISLSQNFKYPPRVTPMMWRAPSPVASVRAI